MNVNDVTLPYPVLGIEDNVAPYPDTDFKFSSETKKYCFDFDFKMENETIQNYVDAGVAEYVCEVNCVSTYLRFCARSKTPHIHIEINREEVLNEITFFCTIAVKTEIKGYTNEGFHEDYKGYSFDLGPGDILAYFGEYTYDAGLQYDKLQAVQQLLVIKKGHDENNIKYNLGTDKIEILLPPTLYDDYKDNLQYKAAFADIFKSSLVFNSLMYALYNIEDNKSTLWARSLRYRIQNEEDLRHFDLDAPEQIPDIVSTILRKPYQQLFGALDSLNTGEED